jgi:hypothetical protein
VTTMNFLTFLHLKFMGLKIRGNELANNRIIQFLEYRLFHTTYHS